MTAHAWVPDAKVCPPAVAPYVVARPRLVDALAQAARGRLTLVVAPAGSGKTTLLSQYVAQSSDPVLWYRCDPADADPTAFIEGIVAAAWSALPAARPLLARARVAVASGAPPFAALRVLVSTLDDIAGAITIVIDDAHHLPAEGGPSLLTHLLEWLPARFHFIVASRAVPELPLVLLTGLSQAHGLGQQELGFAHDEAVTLLETISGQPCPADVVHTLLAQTQGWATALVLYGQISGQHAPASALDLSSPTVIVPGAREALFAYMATSVVAGLPARLHRFLFDVAVLPVFSAAQADALRGAHDAAGCIAALAARGLFLESLPGVLYRFHDLFRSFLENHLRATVPRRWRRLHRQAAVLAEQDGDPARALAHAAQGGTPAALVQLLARLAPRMSTTQQAQSLIAWCEEVPLPARLEHPALVRAHARALLLRGRTEAALAVLEHAAAATRAAGQPTPHGTRWTAADLLALRVLRANALFQLGRLEDAVATADAGLSAGADGDVEVAYLRQIRGCALVRLGRPREGIAEVQTALQVFARQGEDEQIASICHNVGQFLLECGDARSAERYLDRAAQVKKARGQDTLLSSTLLAQGLLHHLRGDTAPARECLQQARALAERTGHVLVEIAALESLGTLAAEQGRCDEASACLRDAQQLAKVTDQEGALLLVECARVRLALAQGDGQRAAAHVHQLRRRASLPGEKGLADLMAGLVSLDHGTPAEAFGHLQQAAAALDGAGLEAQRARALLLLAAAAYRHDARGRALVLLDEVAALVERLGCEGYLVADSPRAAAVLHYARDHPRLRRATQALVSRLIAAGRAAVPAAAAARPPRRVRGGPLAVAGTAMPLRVVSLGSSGVWVGDEPVPPSRWVRSAARELFFFALAHPAPLSRDAILDALWPDEDPAEAQATFWVAGHQLRRSLPGITWIKQENRYLLRLPPASTDDATAFESLASAALCRDPRTPAAPRRAAAERAVDLYGGDYLADFSALWVLPRRARLQSLYRALLLFLVGAARAEGQAARAVQLATRAVAADPLDEEAQSTLIEAHAAAGDQRAALRAYQDYVALLRDELGELPSPALHLLARRLTTLAAT